MNPVPQKQTSWGKGHAYDSQKKVLQGIQWQMRPYKPAKPLEGPVFVDYTFYFPIPKSVTSKVKRRQMENNIIMHVQRPDGSNCEYLIENAMKGIIYKDDAQVTDSAKRKRWAEKGKIIIKILDLNAINHYEIPENIYLQDA